MSGSAHPPFFSVILPVYNGEKYLRQAVESVLAQTYRGWELVIVDDVSTDSTPALIREFEGRDPRVRSIRNSRNINCGPSANRGIEVALGSWITRIDADDVYRPEYLETVHAYAQRHADGRTFLSSWVWIIDDEGLPVIEMKLPPGDTVRRMIRYENFIYHTATAYPRSLWKSVGGYPETQPDLLREGGDDRVLWRKFFASGASLEVIPQPIMHYRIHQGNMSFVDASVKNRKWIVSLYLKQGLLREARRELGRIAAETRRRDPLYETLALLPASWTKGFMWEIRPRLRHVWRRLRLLGKTDPRRGAGSGVLS